MIEVKNLSFSYEKKKQSVFDAFSLGNYEREICSAIFNCYCRAGLHHCNVKVEKKGP